MITSLSYVKPLNSCLDKIPTPWSSVKTLYDLAVMHGQPRVWPLLSRIFAALQLVHCSYNTGSLTK